MSKHYTDKRTKLAVCIKVEVGLSAVRKLFSFISRPNVYITIIFHLFCLFKLQTNDSVARGRYPVSKEMALEFAALMAQVFSFLVFIDLVTPFCECFD